jgi:hypothetical protein
MNPNMPALGAIGDVNKLRAVYLQSGVLAHGPVPGLGNLGVSAFAQTFLDDADAATFRATTGTNSATNLTTGTLPPPRIVGANGIVARTSASAWAARTITGTANKVAVTNGDGVSGNPTLTIPDAVTLVTPTITGLVTLSGGQIAFPATQNASAGPNTLDDYEEGSWTPSITFVTPGDLSVAYSTQNGTYTKIGRVVILTYAVVTSSFTHTTASGGLRLAGVPFSSSEINPRGAVDFGGLTLPAGITVVTSSNTTTNLQFIGSGSATARAVLAATNVPSGGTVVLAGTHVYVVS